MTDMFTASAVRNIQRTQTSRLPSFQSLFVSKHTKTSFPDEIRSLKPISVSDFTDGGGNELSERERSFSTAGRSQI